MDLQQPTKKMSKSDGESSGCVFVLDTPARIAKKIKSAVTDSDTAVRYDVDAKPGVSNLLDIYAAATDRSVTDVAAELASSQYGALKTAVADAVVALLEPVQKRYAELAADPTEVDRVLARGAARARERSPLRCSSARSATPVCCAPEPTARRDQLIVAGLEGADAAPVPAALFAAIVNV